MKKQVLVLPLLLTTLLLQSCALFSQGSRSDFAIPGCEMAWDDIDSAGVLDDFKAVIVNDCSNLYAQGWRLPIRNNQGGTVYPQVCKPAWKRIRDAGKLDSAKFMVTHNCPVFYRNKWIIPPS